MKSNISPAFATKISDVRFGADRGCPSLNKNILSETITQPVDRKLYLNLAVHMYSAIICTELSGEGIETKTEKN
jgi:hypothetical protein